MSLSIIARQHATVFKFKLYSFQANLTSDLTGTIKLLKEQFEKLKAGALGALSNAQDALTNNERKR